MNIYTQKTRSEIPEEYRWNIDRMYPDEAKWKKDLQESVEMSAQFSKFQGHLTDSSEILRTALTLYSDMMRKAEHAFVYSRMRHDEDNANPKYTEMNNRAMSAMAQISAAVSFLAPELTSADPAVIRQYLESDASLQEYDYFLETLLRQGAHTLNAGEENILAQLGEALQAPEEAFSILNDADMHFGIIPGANGEPVEVTHGNFITLMESDNPDVRKNAFTALYTRYRELNHTISVLYHFNVKTDVITSRLRKYPSALEAALAPENIPTAVYDALIHTVHEFLPSLHQYVSIRKRAMKLDSLHMYDIYVPLVQPEGLDCTFEEAVDIACAALAPLGEDYVRVLRRGLLEDRWVDVCENRGKTSGAYSFGSYDSDPYILMNFTGSLKDVFTLVHEGGHSMHSYYTRNTQPYIYGSHSIFTAEVASTVNETLLIRYLLDHAESEEMRTYLINYYIDEFKSTLFRQTMFAEFEAFAHELVEQGESLTAEILNRKYEALNKLYYGSEVQPDEFIQYEWSRIPHFYRSFYVYQYATGYSAANALANGILNDGEPAVRAYREFLTLGDSADPVELLRIAGVDMRTEAPVRAALTTFRQLVDELDQRIY